MVEPWVVVESEALVDNRWLRVRHDVCRIGGNEQPVDYYVVEKSDFAMAVALTTDRQLILVRQYKHGAGQVVLECPAGYIEVDESPVGAVERELREETGYAAGAILPLGTFLVSPSSLNNRAHFFLCLDAAVVGPQHLDATESVKVELIDFDKAVRNVTSGRLELDVASTAALLLAAARVSQGFNSETQYEST